LTSSDTADKNQAYKETRQRIAVLVDQLPAQARLIFKMNRDEGLAYEEIAAILQVSVNTVKTQMYRSLRFLKEQYAAFCG
jgi:RNA polymerase sigma-70 factor (ECF subfamily)